MMKPLEKTSRPNGCTHNPSLRCHEEIMSKCSSNGEPVCCPDNVSEKLKSKKSTKSERTSRKCTKKPVNVKFQDIFETASAPVTNGVIRDSCFKGLRSKSVPLIKNQNFEDSIDFIPVKLTSDSDNKHGTHSCSKSKPNGKSPGKSNLPRPSRTTWDKLLRGENEDLYKSNQTIEQNKKTKHRNINNHHLTNEDLSNKPKACPQSSIASNSNHNGVNTDDSHRPMLLNSPHIENIQLGLSELYASDPASTLDFLIKQLRGRLINQRK